MPSYPAVAATRRAAALLSLALFALLLPITPAHAQRAVDAPDGSAWGAPPGVEPCMAEDDLARRLAADHDGSLAARRELFEQLVAEATRQKLLRPGPTTNAGPSYVIPVAVHIVHMGGIENISDQQVLSQLHALNRDFGDSLVSGPPAVDTKISFCLAQNLPPASSVSWSTTPGITRAFSSETNHTYGNLASEMALKAINYLPSDKYLNIWVVKTIAGGSGGVVGYATFPGTVPATLDGIVMRADVFGSNFTPFGSGYNLLPSNADGKILPHEVGHWLNLYHTFHGGCSPTGDQVADTTPEQVNRSGCPASPTSCTAAPDPIENFMDYTNDPCRWAFTAGQKTRMHTAIAAHRSTLVSAANLIAVGCTSGQDPQIVLSSSQICAGGSINALTTASADSFAWSFPGGSPSSSTNSAPTVTYAAAGTYPVTLTITYNNTSTTNTVLVYVSNCAPILNRCTNWTFGASTGVTFASGAPVAVSGRIPAAMEAATTMSDASGNLLFYSDGVRAITATNVVMPNGNGLLCGGSSHNGVIAIPRPGSSTQHFLFTVRMWEDGVQPDPFNYSVVDMALNSGLGDIPTGQKNIMIPLPGSPNSLLEAIAAIPHCNGTDWWVITNGSGTTSGNINVTLVTSAGPTTTTVYPIGMAVASTPVGAITPNAEGNKLAMANIVSKAVAVYGFNRATGAVTTILAPLNVGAYADAVLSPNGKLLYYAYYIGGVYGVRQLELATLQTRELITNAQCVIKPGPDGKIYIAAGTAPALHTVNFPDNFNTLNANECGLNLYSVPLPPFTSVTLFGSLPNMSQQCTGATVPAAFTTAVTNCLTVQFTSSNCAGPYNWNFGDATTGSGASVSHTYAAPGTYTVTLTVAGASPSVATKTVTVGLAPVSIAGSNTACASPSNYSAIGPPSYTYSWSVSGGSPSFASGDNVDVTFIPSGGTITLSVTDPATGCTATIAKNVGPCPVCKSPPLGMTAWWPLDEPAGTTAIETVQANHGVDQGAPPHLGGMVRRARSFDGTTQYVEANDAPGLNFGTGDLTIDAWVRTTAGTGIQRIVDKLYADPASGWSLYLKNGRLALGLGSSLSASVSEYWSPTSPFVADGQWHHVAGVVERADATTGTRLYVDGTLVATWPGYPATGNLTNTVKLRIGAGNGFGPPIEHFAGRIDEVELFQRAVGGGALLGIVAADTVGKCKEFLYVPVSANLCRDRNDVTVTISVCNWSTAAQTYSLAATGLPAGPGCTFAGPTTFQILGPNPVTVPANSCVPVQVKITRPAGMPLYATSCYQITATNTATSQAIVGRGSIVASRLWCNLVAVPFTDGGLGVGGTGTATARLVFRATNETGGPVTMPYSVRVVPAPGSEGGDGSGTPGDPPTVMLNGLPPDTPLAGDLTLADGATGDVVIDASFAEPRSFRFYDVILAMDEDGDGVPDNEVAHGLTFREGGAATVGVAPGLPGPGLPAGALPTRVELGATVPNPVTGAATVHFALPRAASVSLALYDIAGRRVRTLYAGPAAAGPGALRVDFAGLSRGLYFLRLATDDGAAARRVTVVR